METLCPRVGGNLRWGLLRNVCPRVGSKLRGVLFQRGGGNSRTSDSRSGP